MRVSVTAYFDKENDGWDGSVSYDRDEVDNLYDMSNLVYDVMMATGFTYLKSVYFVKEDGEEVGSDL